MVKQLSFVCPLALLVLLAVLHHTAAYCNFWEEPCNGDYQLNDGHGYEGYGDRFYPISAHEWPTPWKRVSDVAHCGVRSCSKTLTFQESTSSTFTKSDGTTYTVGESESSTSARALAHAYKIGLSLSAKLGEIFTFGVSNDYTLTTTNTNSNTHGTSSSSSNSRSYSVATGKTLSRSESMMCQGNAGDKLYLKTQYRWMEVKGNYCTFASQAGDGSKNWKCDYIEAQIKGVLPGTNQLDMNIMCETERDGEVSLGCRSIAGPTFEDYCKTNGNMGHCPNTHCTK